MLRFLKGLRSVSNHLSWNGTGEAVWSMIRLLCFFLMDSHQIGWTLSFYHPLNILFNLFETTLFLVSIRVPCFFNQLFWAWFILSIFQYLFVILLLIILQFLRLWRSRSLDFIMRLLSSNFWGIIQPIFILILKDHKGWLWSFHGLLLNVFTHLFGRQ